MIHFLYLIGYSFFVAIAFAIFHDGTIRDRILYGLKTFAQFVLVSLLLAWILYFIPW
jgi:TRAP-type mannitol/chloroaromatic compound transport system permease small subunit